MSATIHELRMSFGDHLEELRRRLIRALIAPLVFLIPMLIVGQQLLALFMRPVEKALLSAGLPPRLQVLSPTEAFLTYFKVALVVAFVLSGPVIVWQAWRFVEPGLYDREKRFAHLLVPFSAVLTLVGVTFLYFVVLPLSLNMLIRFGQGINISPLQPNIQWIAPADDDQGNATSDGGTRSGSSPADSADSNDDPAESAATTNSGSAGTAATDSAKPVIDPPAGTGSSGSSATLADVPVNPNGTGDPTSALGNVPVLDTPPATMRTGEMFVHGPTLQLWVMLPNGRLMAADLRPIEVPFEQQFQLRTYINFVFVLVAAFAIAFQLPLVLLLLGWVNLVTPDQLAGSRKYAILGMFFFGAMLTPPDVISQLALGLPLYLLFELSIILLRYFPASRIAGGPSRGDVEY
ncbi:MAG: twin-arginine translocase subunit TatC [Planctomycetota bacterium]